MTAWKSLRQRLAASSGMHDFAQPCAPDDLARLEAEFGPLTETLRSMLREFNGAELFVDAMPLFTFFGARPGTPAVDIAEYTRGWRKGRPERQDWVIGVMNYGGYFILGSDERLREWDSAVSSWSDTNCTAEELVDRLLAEGPEYLATD